MLDKYIDISKKIFFWHSDSNALPSLQRLPMLKINKKYYAGTKKIKGKFIIGGSQCFFLSGKILITSNGNFMIVFDIVSQFYFEM